MFKKYIFEITMSTITEEIAICDAPLGKKSAYITQYNPELLFPIPRKRKRDEINVPTPLPFYGFDTWNAYEISWLNLKGKPEVAMAQFDFSCFSTNIIESKSFKLYLNSFNSSRFASIDEVQTIIAQDIQKAADGEVVIKLYPLAHYTEQKSSQFSGFHLDHLDVTCDTYTTQPSFLKCDPQNIVTETLVTDLLKSNCLVTNQPDWGSVRIEYTGPEIDKAGLLQYIVSFRDHNEFHEQCVERMFMDIRELCQPQRLLIEARYTRRGGLDINPIRGSYSFPTPSNIRLARQ